MEIYIIPVVAVFGSLLTFFCGFGLGTLLTPVFLLFFPVDSAIMLTATVHLLNNIFKLLLVGRHIDFTILLRFGIPAAAGSFAGALLLAEISDAKPIFVYTLFDKVYLIYPVKAAIALIMIVFVFLEMLRSGTLRFIGIGLIGGGLISGFFGGLSGHQGVLRSMILIRCGLDKHVFIATGVAVACMVDITRIPVYFSSVLFSGKHPEDFILLISTVFAAFAGAYIGNKLLYKIKIAAVEKIVAVMIVLISVALGLGLV